MDTDVLIVGAGPTGLMLANQLGRRGIRCMIIDRHAGPARETRALGVQARTMEIYAQLGVRGRAMELGKQGTGATVWANGKRAARVPLGETGRGVTPYPYIFVLGQDDNERILGERLRDFHVEVKWNCELTALEQHDDRVVATLQRPLGISERVTAAWVAGCDGAHSAVRELNGIGFPGAPYEHVFYVADVETTGSIAADEVNAFLVKEGFLLFFPMRGENHWRIVGILPAALAGRKEVVFEDVLPTIRGAEGPQLGFRRCSWFSTYRIHHRAASRFREKRCFVLGDAAHIHSPVGAQGMNTGLQDAYNLAWKLALVVKDEAKPALLDSYEAERLPVARRLLATTDRGFRLAVSDSPFAKLFRTQIAARIAAIALGVERIQRFAFRTVSQIGIQYRDSPLSETGDLPGNAPRAGDRFPWMHLRLDAAGAIQDSFEALDDLHFHLLVIGQPVPKVEAQGVLVHAVPSDADNVLAFKRAGIPPQAFYLLRPDGHIGLCGARLEAGAVERYLASRLGMDK